MMINESEPASWAEVVNTFVDKVLPIMLAGMLGLVPWWVTRNQRKRKVKYELVEALYSYFNHLQSHLLSFNYTKVYSRIIELDFGKYKVVLTQIGNSEPTLELLNLKDMFKDVIEFNKNVYAKYNDDQKQTVKILIELESRIMALISEVEHEYGAKPHEYILSLLKIPLQMSTSNEYLCLHGYSNMLDEELTETHDLLSKEIDDRQKQMQIDCDHLTAEVKKVLR